MRAWGWAWASALALVGLACGKAPSANLTPAPMASLAPLASVEPVDHLGPDELLEGTEKAFGVVLPRDLVIDKRYPDTVFASGPMSVHAMVLYLRPRLQGGSLRESPTVASFEHVTTAALPAYTELTIHVDVVIGRTRVELGTVTHPPAPVLPDEAARWRQVGLTPNGKLLDPTHLD